MIAKHHVFIQTLSDKLILKKQQHGHDQVMPMNWFEDCQSHLCDAEIAH